jgi:hypothetical protein
MEPTMKIPGRQMLKKIGMPAGPLPDRAIATAQAPSENVGQGANRFQAFTYFTKVPVPGESTPILYNGDRLWSRVTLTLETAGPVAVGQASQITPVLSGKGQLLETGVPVSFDISKGQKLYIAATAVNRVKVSVQPLPWMEQIVALLGGAASKAVAGVAKAVGRSSKL